MGVASESGTRSGPCLGPSISELVTAFRSGKTTPADVCRQVLATITARGADGVWISVADEEAVLARCAALAEVDDPSALPLWGIPFGVKDSIDIAGWPTTLACPDYAYVATETAPVVQRLLDAGAVLIGKTNLDQFATGLNGTRTPYPTPRSVYGNDLISGGSSSGSALAVAVGEVPFTVATDTAGSGRVPPALNGILGYKPSRGLISSVGLVPACRSLDCISLIAGTVSDLETVLDVVAAVDDADPWSRHRIRRDETAAELLVGLPTFDHLEFFGDTAMSTAHRAARERLSARLATRSIDLQPFLAAGELLYQGPWVAERYVEFGDFLREHPTAALPVVADIINGGARFSAADVFRAQYRLAELKAVVDRLFGDVDVVVLPTIGTTFTIEEVLAAPIATNTTLGHYTHCGNLLDLCAAAVPAGLTADGRPVSLMVLGPALADDLVLTAAAAIGDLYAPPSA
jgi:allophanate hydrolase